MRTSLLSGSLALALAVSTSCAGAEVEAEAADTTGPVTGTVSVDLFQDALSPYGLWIRNPDYGRVWIPSAAVVGADFTPYATGGRWEYSTAGWMFVSDWDWGWAPFHYGRWYLDPFYGWAWVPDTLWAPAWVDWRIGGGLIGWAPLPPTFPRRPLRDHRTRWVFVGERDFRRPVIGRHLIAPTARSLEVTAPVRHRMNAGGTYWFAGPDRARVEAATGAPVRAIRVTPPRPGAVARMQVEGGAARPVPLQARRTPRATARWWSGPVEAPPLHRESRGGARGRRR
ncbi:MAG TPA: DUF6600 domain-containing protein [Kofleriaceae bacterium]|nr:DUF6600 domain-containing protein [Kofleriaceae bacterium]